MNNSIRWTMVSIIALLWIGILSFLAYQKFNHYLDDMAQQILNHTKSFYGIRLNILAEDLNKQIRKIEGNLTGGLNKGPEELENKVAQGGLK